jgi:hypothetical protein
VSFRALKDWMMYGSNDDPVDVFFIFVVLVLGDGDPGFVFGRWEDDGKSGRSRNKLASPGVSRFAIFFLMFCFFVSCSASGMTCGYLGRPGAAHCDLSFCSCFVLSISFLVLIFLLADVRRALL